MFIDFIALICQGQEYQDCSDEEFKKMTDFVRARLETAKHEEQPTSAEPVLNRRSYLTPKRKRKEELWRPAWMASLDVFKNISCTPWKIQGAAWCSCYWKTTGRKSERAKGVTSWSSLVLNSLLEFSCHYVITCELKTTLRTPRDPQTMAEISSCWFYSRMSVLNPTVFVCGLTGLYNCVKLRYETLDSRL